MEEYHLIDLTTGESHGGFANLAGARESLNQVVSATLANDGISSSAGYSVTITNIGHWLDANIGVP